jgi:glycosyltransferase involved in cell wall biosynthesis
MKEGSIRIAFIITGLGTGGAEMMLLQLVQKLSQRFEPLVISLTKDGPIGEQLRKNGYRVEAIGLTSLFSAPPASVRLYRRLRQFQPHIVHTWMYHADLIGGLIARLASVRRIAWGIHHSNLSPAFNRRSTLFIARLCGLLSPYIPDRIFACSEAVKEEHIQFGYRGDRMQVIPNGIDVDLFKIDDKARSELRSELGLPEDAILIGCIGRYHPQKNHEGFFAGVSRLNLDKAHFVLAGNGIHSANAELVSMIARYGLEAKVHLLGVRHDMPRIMASLDLLVSTSFGEAFSNVLAEAMACGVPCVVNRPADPAGIAADLGRTIHVDGSPDELARAIRELLEVRRQEGQRLQKMCRQRIIDRFSLDRMTSLYETGYQQLLSS